MDTKKLFHELIEKFNHQKARIEELESSLQTSKTDRNAARKNYDKLVFQLDLADKAAQKWRNQFQAAEAEIERLNSEVLGRGEENLEILKRLDTEKKVSQKYCHLLNKRAFEVQAAEAEIEALDQELKETIEREGKLNRKIVDQKGYIVDLEDNLNMARRRFEKTQIRAWTVCNIGFVACVVMAAYALLNMFVL